MPTSKAVGKVKATKAPHISVRTKTVGKSKSGKMPKIHSTPKTKAKVSKVMEEFKKGTLKSGGSGKKVTNRKQGIAIALSESRKAGKK